MPGKEHEISIVRELSLSDLALQQTAARLRGDDERVEEIEGYIEQHNLAQQDGIILRFYVDQQGSVSWQATKRPTMSFKDLPRKDNDAI